jgi:uncharacterized membrane protein YgcG
MAQTKRKRRTKHRGNAAGVVESRGRTGRKPTAAEKKGDAQKAKGQALDRRDRPPTWRAAFIKGMFAAVVLLLFVLFFTPKSGSLVALFPIVLAMYTVISCYTDRWVFNRRQRNKARRAGGGKASSR